MTRHRVIVMPLAQRQLNAALRWWLRNRDKAPNALEDDFAEALELLADRPGTGWFHGRRRRGVVRRVLMGRVRYYVYYRITAKGVVEVLQLWHASRRPPTL
jgi:plasmid stabilization system protein ParE